MSQHIVHKTKAYSYLACLTIRLKEVKEFLLVDAKIHKCGRVSPSPLYAIYLRLLRNKYRRRQVILKRRPALLYSGLVPPSNVVMRRHQDWLRMRRALKREFTRREFVLQVV